MKKNSRLLIFAIPVMAILLGAVAYEYGYVKMRAELRERDDAVSVKEKTLEKTMALIADKPRLEMKSAALAEARKTGHAKMIEGETPAIAAAALQGMLKAVIASRGGIISSDRVEKAEDAGKLKMITVTIDAVLPDTRALADALYAVETQTPYLIVRELDIRIRNFREPRDLMVKLKVSGLTGGL